MSAKPCKHETNQAHCPSCDTVDYGRRHDEAVAESNAAYTNIECRAQAINEAIKEDVPQKDIEKMVKEKRKLTADLNELNEHIEELRSRYEAALAKTSTLGNNPKAFDEHVAAEEARYRSIRFEAQIGKPSSSRDVFVPASTQGAQSKPSETLSRAGIPATEDWILDCGKGYHLGLQLARKKLLDWNATMSLPAKPKSAAAASSSASPAPEACMSVGAAWQAPQIGPPSAKSGSRIPPKTEHELRTNVNAAYGKEAQLDKQAQHSLLVKGRYFAFTEVLLAYYAANAENKYEGGWGATSEEREKEEVALRLANMNLQGKEPKMGDRTFVGFTNWLNSFENSYGGQETLRNHLLEWAEKHQQDLEDIANKVRDSQNETLSDGRLKTLDTGPAPNGVKNHPLEFMSRKPRMKEDQRRA